MKNLTLLFIGVIMTFTPTIIIAQSNHPIDYSTLLENQKTSFLKGNGEVLVIDGIAWERPYGESIYAIPPTMPSIQEYLSRITQSDDAANGIFKSKFSIINVEVTELSKSLLKDMGIFVMQYVTNKVYVYLPQIDIDKLTQNNVSLTSRNN